MYDPNTSNANKISREELRDSECLAEECRSHLIAGGPMSPMGTMLISKASSLQAAQVTLGAAEMRLLNLRNKYQIPLSEFTDGGKPQDVITGAWHPLSKLWCAILMLQAAIMLEVSRK